MNFDFKMTCLSCKTQLRLECVFLQLVAVAGEQFKCPVCGAICWIEAKKDQVAVLIESGYNSGFSPSKEAVQKIKVEGLQVSKKTINLSRGIHITWKSRFEWFIPEHNCLLQLLMFKVEKHFVFFELRFEHEKISLIRVDLKKGLVEEIESFSKINYHQQATLKIKELMPLQNQVPQLFEWKSGFSYQGLR